MTEFWAIGLMSGTSMDGIDAALLRTDGRTIAAFGPWRTEPYAPSLRRRLRGILGGNGDVAGVERALTEAHAEVVHSLLAHAGLAAAAVRVLGFHGHTILHRPEERRTWQIGDGGLLARLTGIPVVNDFRSADVAAGGQGAPLVPLYHAALAAALPRPLAVLNIGGVANITAIDREGEILAFDTGPGNAPLDDWLLRQTGSTMDLDGALAAAGQVDEALVQRLLAHPYFRRRPPKSLDRDDFTSAMVAGLSAADGAATLTAFTARAAAAAAEHLPEPPRHWLVCGGGRHNPVMMQALASALPGAAVAPVESVGWRGDALEAEAFGFLALRALQGLPLSLPGTTGVPAPLTGGRLWPVTVD